MPSKRLPSAQFPVRDDKNRIQTYEKLDSVLRCFSTVDRRRSLADIAHAAHLPRTTAHRILTALRDIGFIEQDSLGEDYGLGIRLFELGSLALANMDLHREAKPFLDRVARLAEESAHLGVFNGLSMVVVERENRGARAAQSFARTEIAPAYCTGLGKAVLAFQDASVIARVVKAGLAPFTKRTITSPTVLARELASIRRAGYAVDRGEHHPLVQCVAAPIRNGNGRAFAAISVTGSRERITDARLPALGKLVMQTAAAISRQLGFRSIP